MNMKSKGASLYILNVPGVGMIEAHMSPSQALRFAASIETQLDEKIPRSLRIAPATLGEIDTREARNALRQALETEQEPVAWIKKDRSAIEVSIMSAEYMTNEGFEPLYTAPCQTCQSLVAVETQTLRAALDAAVAWAAPMADAPKSARPAWFDQARAALSHKGSIQ